jgi:hypothetical protein
MLARIMREMRLDCAGGFRFGLRVSCCLELRAEAGIFFGMRFYRQAAPYGA